ncbi:MAG TPA: di-heme oxidoredictase family protein [Candidatus Limnocylindrales bacterium]|nr:di-heme oxidoredictase family protein [Candidatus Limnocylindrales bacterium]
MLTLRGTIFAALAAALSVAGGLSAVRADEPATRGDRATLRADGATVRADGATVRADGTTIVDDVVLTELLQKAIDLRRREDFDRMLDARDPGELVEHATLTDLDFDYRKLGIDSLFIVGDELFSYPFRPENGWGGKGRRADAVDYTPSPRRVHEGLAGGPDAFACASCHSKGGPDGAGTQTQNAFLRGDGLAMHGADQRNPPHVLGLGPVEILAREMTAELAGEAAAARDKAKKEQQAVDEPLTAKGVSFGRIGAAADGTLDYANVEGIDHDLVVRPFGWKGHQARLREMIEESLQIHQGLLSKRIQLGVKDGTVDPAPYGKGRWDDVDEDGVSLEIDSGMLTTVVGYLAQLEVPVVRPPHDARLLDMFAAGSAKFDAIGCAGCHVRTLPIKDPKLDAADGTGRAPFLIDVSKDGDGPKVEPLFAGPGSPYLVHLFSDLKRHDMGEALASRGPEREVADREIPARMFLTRPLWGLAESAPYLHDGRAPTIDDAITLHGGEAAAARDAYVALPDSERASVRVFLTSLSRAPKLFVP